MRIDPGIAEMYTMTRSAKPVFYLFVVDASPPRDKDGDGIISETEKPAELGEEYDISPFPEMKKAFDAPIADLARALKACVRDVDIVARWGGEEIAVIFPDTGLARARAIAERIRGEVGGKEFPCEAGVFAVTVSIGIFTLRGGTALAPEDAIRRADAALYRAKEGGRNRAEVWERA